jgi:BirA family biotin operon repressor/biotin-[acetyl-CoA-carboxylase] ligase
MLSMGWRFTCGPGGLSGLSLAAGLAVLCALERYGVGELSLKWPNDILCRGRKLGGLLLDLQGEASGPSDVVFGLGVNGYLAAADARRIDQPWIDLAAVTGRPVARNRLVALILRELFETIERFADKGFAAFRDEWHRRHAHQGAAVCVIQDEQRFNGVADGVDEHGALRLRDSRGQVRVFHSGDVSLRAPGRPA